jgi:hypothetical protein
LSADEQAQAPAPHRSQPIWADTPWRASTAIVGVATVVLLIIGPIDTDRQLGAAVGRAAGALLWSALFLGWHPRTRRWLPTATLVLAVVGCLAAVL